ncbi:MAG: hypothetical protein JNL50_12780, partial [Phycisphaerae bacterium]|nr:hypothetical protein [Phycisphaerae bacterium]
MGRIAGRRGAAGTDGRRGLGWLAFRFAVIMGCLALLGGVVVPGSRGSAPIRPASHASTGDGCQDDWFASHGGGGFGDCTGGSNAGDGDPDDPNDDNVGDEDPPPYDDEEPPGGPGECCEYPEIEGCDCDGDADNGSGEGDDTGDTDGDGDVDEDDDDDDPDPPPFKKYIGTVWGGAASVFLNGIGTPSLWESNLLRPGETAGPLAPSPEGTIVPATGYGIDENTDLVVQLPGRNFELTRNFSGDSPLLRVGSFGPFQMGGWSLSTDACVFPDLVPVSKPHRVIAGDAWKRMGVVVLIQSPIRTTIGFHNYLTYKPETAWYSQAHEMLPPPSGVINGEDYSLTEEDTRTFRPMGPGLARIVADRLEFRQPFERDYGVNKNQARLPVWKVIEPGRGTSYFFRTCESNTTCINLSKQGGGFDADPAFPYNQATLDKVPAGRLWCQIDEFGNVWSYEYKMLKVDGGTTPRLSAIYLHGQDADGASPGTLAKAVVRFHWKLMRRADGTFLGSRVWHLSMVTVERPYRAEAQGAVKWAITDKVNYEYHGDLLVKLEGALGTAPDLSALGPLMDDLVLVTRSTGVHLPMSLDSREFTGDDGLAWHTQHTHYRYAVHVDPNSSSKLSVQIKGVYGPSQIDALVRDSWSDSEGLSLWERGFAIMPAWEGEHRHFDAAALTLMTLNDVAEIAPTRGPGAAMPPLQLWQAADRWTTFHAHARTVPLLGTDDGGSTDPEHRGKVRSEYSKPGLGGPTMRRDFAYSREAEDVYDHEVVRRKARLFPTGMTNPFDLRHSYLLRSRVQVATEWTTESDQASPTPDPWAGEAWTRRRRITTRSEERELLSFQYEFRAADDTPLGLKSLVSVVPFTVAELVEELNAAGERTRSWLTTHEFDEYNRPTRTIDPGAFTDPYELEDTSDAWVVKCRLRDWRLYVSQYTDPARLGSIQSTEYHDLAEPSDLFSARFAEIQAAGGNTRFQMNYPSTLRVGRSWQGTHGSGGALLEVQSHPGELSYYGRFRRYGWIDHAWVMMPRPDLVWRVWRSRTGHDVNPDEAGEQFESVGFDYTLVDRDTPRMGYPAVARWTRFREREGAEQNGPGGSEVTTEYIDARGRTKYRVSPGGVATAFVHDPDSGDGARDLTGAPTEVHQHVTLGNLGSDGIPESFADIAWDQGDGTLTARSRRDVSGRLLLFESADAVATARAYDVRPYADPNDPDAPPAPTPRALTFPPESDDGKHAGPIEARFFDGAGRVFRQSTFAVGSLERNPAGLVTAWTTGQEYARSHTGYYLSGLAEREVVYPFASVGGVFPGVVPDQDGDRSAPAVTRRAYDGDASPVRSVDALGNTERIEYDARSRPVRTHRGVEGFGDQLVEERFYDGEGPERGAVGDGLLTLVETHTAAGHAGDQIRRTRSWYDTRHRPTLTGQVDGAGACVTPLGVTVHDNLDRPVLTAQWSAGVTPPGGVWFAVSEQELAEDTSAIGVRRTSHGPRGAVYREETLIERGAEAMWQRTDHWFDADGKEIATSSPGTATVKRRFDPHARVVGEWTSAGVPATFADASDPTKGFVLREALTTHWRGKTLPVLTTLRERTHTTVPTSGSLSDDAIGTDPLKAVTSYSAVAYDRAARPVATINYGTNNAASEFTSVGGAAPTPIEAWQSGNVSSAIPGVAGAEAIVSRTAYDERGQASVASRWLGVNPAGGPTSQEATRSLTDSLGRAYATIENDSNPAGSAAASITWSTQGGGRWSATGMSVPATDQNRVTSRVYDHAGNVTRHVAHRRTQAGAEAVQTTAFRYAWDEDLDGAAAELPSLSRTSSVLREIRYPSTAGSGEPSEAPIDRVKFAYNALGEQTAVKDQNGTIRDFLRDGAGRLIADRVRVFGAT